MLVAAALIYGFSSATPQARAAGSISLAHSTVPQSASVGVSGSGFTAQNTVTVFVDAPVNGQTQHIQTTVTTDANGDFSTHLNLPRAIAAGTYTLTAKDTNGVSATQRLNVLTLIVLRVGGGTAGATVTDRQRFFADVIGVQNGETVKLQATFPTYSGNSVVETRTPTADQHGNFYSVLLTAPNGAKLGWADMSATGQTSNKQAQGRVYVAYHPYVVLKSSSVAAGDTATIVGHGFVSDAQVKVNMNVQTADGKPMTLTTTATADSNGNFQTSLRIPSNAAQASYTLTATDLTAGFKRYARLAVQAGSTQPSGNGRISVDVLPSVTLPNETVTFVGSGYAPNINVTISLTVDLRGGGNRAISHTVTTDSSGGFTADILVPYRAAQGTYTVTTRASNGQQSSSTLKVLALSMHPAGLNFRWVSLWYHTVRQGTWDVIVLQSTLQTQLGIWAHVIFPNGLHYDYYTNTDNNGQWKVRFNVPARAASSHSNQAYVTFQLWHGKQTSQSFMDFTLV
jgi:hypothetical protein